MTAAHIEIRGLCALVTRAVSEVPAALVKGSPRQTEMASLRSTAGGGGYARAKLLEELSGECHLLASSLLLIADGVADCLEVAAGRDNVVNWPVLTITTRPVLEIAGQIAWLLDDKIDGGERARRYLVWRLADLRDRRLLLRDFRATNDPEALAEIEMHEKELLDAIAAAKWQAAPTILHPNGDLQAAALLDAGGKREKMPSLTEMVRLVSSTPSVYAMLSISAHGARVGTMYSLNVGDQVDRQGRRTVQVGGFGLPPNFAIGLTAVAVSFCGRLIAGWNGLDASRIQESSVALLKHAGIG